ncbi:2323_t:CDS:1, partial [Acaulospora morrowiae]
LFVMIIKKKVTPLRGNIKRKKTSENINSIPLHLQGAMSVEMFSLLRQILQIGDFVDISVSG